MEMSAYLVVYNIKEMVGEISNEEDKKIPTPRREEDVGKLNILWENYLQGNIASLPKKPTITQCT